MAERITPIRKTPVEILNDLVDGHRDARIGGAEKGMKYLLAFIGRAHSLPNAVKFFLYDLLAEDAFRSGDFLTCRKAVDLAPTYLSAARDEMPHRVREYVPSIRLYELGIALALDDGEFEKALALCDAATAIGLGKSYAAKRASIERMM